MTEKLTIRPEEEKDIIQISRIIRSAFADHPHSNQQEHLIVDELRASEVPNLSLVAEYESDLVGHIAFSRVTVNGEELSWYGLAPVSVDPDFQNQGIGSALVRAGLRQLKNMKASGCVLVGEPSFYQRFGFQHTDALTYPGIPGEYFLVQSFSDYTPSGTVKYHDAFETYS